MHVGLTFVWYWFSSGHASAARRGPFQRQALHQQDSHPSPVRLRSSTSSSNEMPGEVDLPGVEDSWNTYPSTSPLAVEDQPRFDVPRRQRSSSSRSSASQETHTPPPHGAEKPSSHEPSFEACFESAFGEQADVEVQPSSDDPWAAMPVSREDSVRGRRPAEGRGQAKRPLTSSASVNIFRQEDDPFGDDFFGQSDRMDSFNDNRGSLDNGEEDDDKWKDSFRSFDFSKFS